MMVTLNRLYITRQHRIRVQPPLRFEFLDVGAPDLFGVVDEYEGDVDAFAFGYD